jgi:hypothetical protein
MESGMIRTSRSASNSAFQAMGPVVELARNPAPELEAMVVAAIRRQKIRKFDLIAANLPHFPMQAVSFGSRTPSWGCGGLDGRRFLDPFLKGLQDHLDRDGL